MSSSATWRICKRCDKRCQIGTHFEIKDPTTGNVLRRYDICRVCMITHSPLYLPLDALSRPIKQYSVHYESFDDTGATCVPVPRAARSETPRGTQA